MNAVYNVLGSITMLSGVALIVLASIGMVRLPDVFARMHAQTKPAVLGTVLIFIGAALLAEALNLVWIFLATALFQVLTMPVGAQMLSRALYWQLREGDSFTVVRDDYADQHRGPRSGASKGDTAPESQK